MIYEFFDEYKTGVMVDWISTQLSTPVKFVCVNKKDSVSVGLTSIHETKKYSEANIFTFGIDGSLFYITITANDEIELTPTIDMMLKNKNLIEVWTNMRPNIKPFLMQLCRNYKLESIL